VFTRRIVPVADFTPPVRKPKAAKIAADASNGEALAVEAEKTGADGLEDVTEDQLV